MRKGTGVKQESCQNKKKKERNAATEEEKKKINEGVTGQKSNLQGCQNNY